MVRHRKYIFTGNGSALELTLRRGMKVNWDQSDTSHLLLSLMFKEILPLLGEKREVGQISSSWKKKEVMK